MKEVIALEFYKTRRRRVWVIIAAMIFVQMLWSVWGVGRMDAHDLSQGWMFFLYKLPLLNSIMMPVIAAVVASRLSDIEHKGQTFKLLNTVMPAGRLFDAKFICGALYLLAAVLLQIAVMVVIGCVVGFEGNPPVGKLFLYLLFTMAATLTILLLQQALSLLFANQMIALSVGLIGGLAGLFIMFFPQGLERFLLWGYYGVLMLVGMDWDAGTRIMNLHYMPVDWGGLVALTILFCALYVVGRTLFVRKEM
ncbi:MAG: ABC transporter permease [Eubacteriales bacterium]|nr:ABC transporter permease [Eubacteriales bacterium]